MNTILFFTISGYEGIEDYSMLQLEYNDFTSKIDINETVYFLEYLNTLHYIKKDRYMEIIAERKMHGLLYPLEDSLWYQFSAWRNLFKHSVDYIIEELKFLLGVTKPDYIEYDFTSS